MRITRRELAATLAAAPLAAQAPEEKPSEDPAELRKQASERLRRSTAALKKTALPMATEPAFSFKA